MSSKSMKFILAATAIAAGAAAINACTPAETAKTGSGGSTGSTNSGGSTGSTNSGGSTGSTNSGGSTGSTNSGGSTGSTGTGGSTGTTGSGGSTGTTGTGGTTVVQKLCATKIVPMNPVLANFEDYNGMVAADKYGAAFGGATAGAGTSYIGPMSWGDGSTTPTLSILAGHPPGSWGLSQTVTKAAKWGMGGGFWMSNCADAKTFKGVTFWVRGQVPGGTFSLTLNMESTTVPDPTNSAGGGTCPGTVDTCKPAQKQDIPITMDWTEVKILWSDFAPGLSGTTSVVPNGDNISGFGWSVNVPFIADPTMVDAAMPNYIPVASDLVFNLDDLAFIP